VPRLGLHLLGPPLVERDGVPLKFRRRRSTALLAYLAVTGDACTREALAALFWPEHDASRARAGLRGALAALKKAVGEGWLSIDRETIGLDPGAEIWLDVRAFRDRLAACRKHDHAPEQTCPACLAALAEAAALYRDEFLAGSGVSGSPAFDEWQFFQAEGLRRDLAWALERLARSHGSRGEFEPAIEHARRWVALDPLNEPAYRCLMELYARSDQRAAALRQYGECERVLQEELGVAPEEETARLYEAIQHQREVAASAADRLQARYRLGAELGQGGMATVYRAHDTLLDRDVAVKVLSGAALDSEGRAHLLREAQAAAGLNHPNIVSVYDAGEVGGAPAIVMELVEGATAPSGAAIVLPASSTWPTIVDVARQICAALAHAHGHGIVHRDLKPENVLLARHREGAGGVTVKLVDFGLARSMASRITTEGKIAGTAHYLAPELALGQPYDGRADLYSLGVMLYEQATGRLPFVADDTLAVISQHVHAPVVPPRVRNAAIPPALDRLIVRLLSKKPEDRPTSAAEVLDLLEAPGFLEGKTLPAEKPSVLERIERGRMVGREREMARAAGLWQQTAAGRGQVLLVAGEPGVGKTRLVRELATQARVLGGKALQGACYAEGGVPYAPFAWILEQAVTGNAWARLDLPGTVLADLCTLAPALCLRFPDVPGRSETDETTEDPRAEQHRLFESVALCFVALSEQVPLMLVLEDVQWADSGSLSLLRHLARQAPRSRTMVVATYRDVDLDEARPLHEVLLDLQRERLATRLKLSRLDREATRALLAVLFDDEITPDFLAGIYGETEGNPFFVEEVCKALVESGRLHFEDGRWHRPSIEELGVPQSVRVAVQARLRTLPAEAQETLRLAAVLGREFEFDILAEASDRAEEELIEALEDAERAQLVEQVSVERGGTYALVHALIASTLVEGLRVVERRQLHRRAAAAIEARRPGDDSRLEALAYHYSQAGVMEKAAAYFLQAGDRARGLYAYHEAIDQYRQAVHYLKELAARSDRPERELGRAARVLIKLGLTYHNILEFKAAQQAYREGFGLWRRAGEVEPAGAPPPAPHALRVGGRFVPQTLNPMASAFHELTEQLFSSLVELTPEMDIVPDVARSWEVSEGGRLYVFHLRDDVRWSDGVPVTAGDFEYAWKMRLEPGAGRLDSCGFFDIVGARGYHFGLVPDPGAVGVRALGPSTLAVELEEPSAYFLQVLALDGACPVPRHVVEAHGEAWATQENLVTNGPFRLESWQPGQSVTLVRSPTYHRRFRGNVDRVEWISPVDPYSPVKRYEAGDLDVAVVGLHLTGVERTRQRHAEDYLSPPATNTSYVGFRVNRPPFDDSRVRRAFALAIDRQAVAEAVMRGGTLPALGGFVPPGLPGHSPGIGFKYDPDGARQLLADAGYPGGSDFSPLESMIGFPAYIPLSACLQEQWRDVLQIDVQWQLLEAAKFVDRLDTNSPNLFLFAYGADYPDPDSFLRVCPAKRRTGWRNEAFDRLVARARGPLDQSDRMALYRQADQILVEEAPIVPLFYQPWHLLVKPWVTRYPVSPMSAWFLKDAILEPH
jgi:ABC-type transport system substrate-binding protein/DNA-binding SARP family transcriptional activator